MPVTSLQCKRLAALLIFGLGFLWLPAVVADIPMRELVGELRGQLDQQTASWIILDLDRKRLHDFYAPRNFQPVWVNTHGPLQRAEQLRQTLILAEEEGLEPEAYPLSLIAQHWTARTAAELARLELLLTNTFFLYSKHVRAGRFDPGKVDPLWHIATPDFNAVKLLNTTLAAANFGAALRDLPPPHAGYRRLREALARYRQRQRNGGWPQLPAGPYLKYGLRHPQISLLRRRLLAEGDLHLGPVKDSDFFDQAVKYAVERFQVRHGLKMDGIVGAASRAAMNVPISERIEQIKLNMERWRWLPRHLGRRYLMVNTAGYELTAIENAQPLFSMWVIIGKPERPTPAVRGVLHTVVFNPYWTVPSTIVFEDLIPEQQRNPNFLKSRGIRVFSNRRNGEELDAGKIDWSQVDKEHFPYVLRQDPGPTNPMGRIKFLFSNAFKVYLHDTPTRRLFNRQVRAFSSGCIRVEDPVRLAVYLLGAENRWTRKKIRETIASGESRKVPVPKAMPIYLVYWTAWVGADNAVSFREDVYDRDSPLSKCGSAGEEKTG